MFNFSKSVDIGFKIWIILFISIMWSKPQNVGEWLANVDIAYDSIWMEYIADCDCVENLE